MKTKDLPRKHRFLDPNPLFPLPPPPEVVLGHPFRNSSQWHKISSYQLGTSEPAQFTECTADLFICSNGVKELLGAHTHVLHQFLLPLIHGRKNQRLLKGVGSPGLQNCLFWFLLVALRRRMKIVCCLFMYTPVCKGTSSSVLCA